jgi:hypothetical protein
MLAVTPARRRPGGIEPSADSRCIRSALSPLSYRPVGHLGVEPSATALSERPLHRLGSGQRKMEGTIPSDIAPGRVQAGGRSLTASSSLCGWRGTRTPSAVARATPLRTALLIRPDAIHGRRTENSNPSARAPVRFPDDAGALTGSSSMAESGAVEAHAQRRALVSSEARSLIGSLSLRTVPGTRTRNLHGLSVAPLPDWARTAWSE